MGNNFAGILRELIRERGLTQMELAELLGMAQSQMSNLLNGKNLPSYYTVKTICTKFSISADYVMGLL